MFWLVGIDAFPSWKDESPLVWEANQKLLAAYESIEPMRPAILFGVGWFTTDDQVHGWINRHTLQDLKACAELREKVIDSVVEELAKES